MARSLRSIISGVYLITNQINGKVYIGSSKNILDRLSHHKYLAKKVKHHNQHLQATFDKYGMENFSFEIWERCPVRLLIERERYWIDAFDSADKVTGYNTSNDTTCPARGKKQSSENIEKRAANNRKYRKFVNPDGVAFETNNTKKFATEHKLNYEGLTMVANGRRANYKGWRLATLNTIGFKFESFDRVTFIKNVAENQKKTYNIIDPKGRSVTFHGLAEFCRINNLSCGTLLAVMSGSRHYHKGYRKTI